MQGAAAIFAVVAGFRALSEWRNRELKKRQVHIAEDVLEKALNLSLLISTLMHQQQYDGSVDSARKWVRAYRHREKARHRAQGNELATLLRSTRPLIDHYLGPKVSSAIDALLAQWHVVNIALTFIERAEEEKTQERWLSGHTKDLAITFLGGIKTQDGDAAIQSKAKTKTIIEERVEKVVATLVAECNRHMTF